MCIGDVLAAALSRHCSISQLENKIVLALNLLKGHSSMTDQADLLLIARLAVTKAQLCAMQLDSRSTAKSDKQRYMQLAPLSL